MVLGQKRAICFGPIRIEKSLPDFVLGPNRAACFGPTRPILVLPTEVHVSCIDLLPNDTKLQDKT